MWLEEKLMVLLYCLLGYASAHSGCNPLTLSSNRWAANITFTPHSVLKIRCPLINTGDHCGIVNLVEWFRSEDQYRNRVPVQTAFLIDPLTFYFESPSEEDSGWYTCVVGNNVGVTELSTYVHFKGFEKSGRRASVPLPLRSRPTSSQMRIPIRPSVPEESPETSTTIEDYLNYIQSRTTHTAVNHGRIALVTPPTPKRPILPSPKELRNPSQVRGFTNFNWNQDTSPPRSQHSPPPPEDDNMIAASSSSYSQTVAHQSPSFKNKQWNTAYKDEDLSEHLRYIYERMAELESQLQSLQTRIDQCQRLNC